MSGKYGITVAPLFFLRSLVERVDEGKATVCVLAAPLVYWLAQRGSVIQL